MFRVLFVDDDPYDDEVLILRKQLDPHGIEVHWHHFISFAVADVTRKGLKPDLIVVDFCGTTTSVEEKVTKLLPQLDGYSICITSDEVLAIADDRWPCIPKKQLVQYIKDVAGVKG